ncbi:MAG TPA: 2OG-Fe(II) oxygenase family protein [Candidatus Paceibacterota bacterium]|nr:2OG-Fe(II) oxygenase family protein [Candidatus Paceibacterota bacterium]
MLQEIPVVNLDCLLDPGTITTVSKAFHDIGFVFVRAPRICAMMPDLYFSCARVFGSPYWVKAQYDCAEIGHQRGWTPPFSEEAIFCRLNKRRGDRRSKDAKENWFMGPVFPDDHPLVKQFPALYPRNVWPEEVPEFRQCMETCYAALFPVGREVLRSVASYLGYGAHFFDELLRDAPTVMRAIHYPRITEDQAGNVEWGCRHTDINLITLLPPSTKLSESPEAGLWVRRRDGVWIPGKAPEGCLIAQVGDELEHWTGGHFLSTDHEVRPPARATLTGRYSIADFFHVRSDVLIEPDRRWANGVYKPIRAGEFVLRRLREIGLLA